MDEYPQQKAQIQQYKRDYENSKAYQNTNESIGYRYQVELKEKSKWSIGEPEALIHIGNTSYYYQHKIRMLLICGENTFSSPRYKNKNISWKISEKIKGETSTSNSGDLKIVFDTTENSKFSEIQIKTSKKTYKINLVPNLFVELDPDECQ